MGQIISHKNIIEINKEGIIFLNNNNERCFIDFKECRKNWVDFVNSPDSFFNRNDLKENETNCVGCRDAFEEPRYIELFSNPTVKFVFDYKPSLIDRLFKSGSTKGYKFFREVQEAIISNGWSTFDMG